MVYGFSTRWSSRLGSSLSWFMVLSHGILFWALMVGLQEVELKVGVDSLRVYIFCALMV